MTFTKSQIEAAKRAAANQAAEFIENGMKVGLGTGSTAYWFVRALSDRVKMADLSVVCVPTSAQTAEQAQSEGLEIATLEDTGWLDITVDGADELDANLNLIKGGGGALLIEKIVASASDAMVVIADETKYVRRLGAFPLPIEVTRFGWSATQTMIETALQDFDVDGFEGALRMEGETPFMTDEGNYILDFHLKRIGTPRRLSAYLNTIPGVVENGLFCGIASQAVVGSPDGSIAVIEAGGGEEEEDENAA